MGYHRNIHHTFADSPYPTKRIQMLKELRRVQKQEFENQIKYTNLIDNMPILYMKEKVIRNETGILLKQFL